MDAQRLTAADAERTERRLNSAFGALPYVLLLVCLLITLLLWDEGMRPGRLLAVVVLSVLAATWIALFSARRRRRPDDPRLNALYYAGLTALAGALVLLAPSYGLFAFVGYIHAHELLPGRWSWLGAGTTSLIMAVTYMGGIDRIEGADWGLWLGIAMISTLLSTIFFQLVRTYDHQVLHQQEALARLEEANQRLEVALSENAELHAKLLGQAREAGVQDERERLAREIHDTLAQDLAGILTQLQGARETLDDPLATRRRLDLAVGLAREGLVEARRSVHAVGPALLARSELPTAVEDIARRWTAEYGVRAQTDVVGDPRPLHADVEGTVLRVTQEALANVAAHARAGHVAVTLTYMGDQVGLDVRDDGCGFDPEAQGPGGDRGYGLSGMRRRAQRLAGRMVVESAPGDGTALSLLLPAISVGTAGSGP